MGLERLDTHGGQHERTSARRRLEGQQHEVLVDLLELLPNLDLARLEIDIRPAQAGRFSETESAGEGDTEERRQALCLRGLQERSGLLDREGADRPNLWLRDFTRLAALRETRLESLRIGQS